LVKGKPWTKEQEKMLIIMFRKRKPVDVIAAALKTTEDSVQMKIRRLGLEEVDQEKNQSSSSRLPLPQEVPTIENIMKRLSAALAGLEIADIDKKEIIRLRSFIQGAKVYKELFADFVQYREIEAELVELNRQYDACFDSDSRERGSECCCSPQEFGF